MFDPKCGTAGAWRPASVERLGNLRELANDPRNRLDVREECGTHCAAARDIVLVPQDQTYEPTTVGGGG
jgi:hypothetical protein